MHHRRTALLFLSATLFFSAPVALQPAQAEKYQSRLNQLLIKKSDLYMPTRLVIGQEAHFVVKAQPGSLVKVFISPKGEGYTLTNGTPLRVGEDVQTLSGTVPENGVLSLPLEMPKEEELEGKVLYVDAVAGPSEDALTPIDLVDASGHRTDENTLVITKPADTRNGPAIMPSMPGLNPQLFNQLSQLGEMSKDKRKELLDNGEIDHNRQADQNPFVNRGIQPGLK